VIVDVIAPILDGGQGGADAVHSLVAVHAEDARERREGVRFDAGFQLRPSLLLVAEGGWERTYHDERHRADVLEAAIPR